MARVRLKGVKVVRKTLADGSIRLYHYHAATMKPLPGPLGSPAFMKVYADAEASTRSVPADQFRSLISKFKASSEFTEKSASSRTNYGIYIKRIEDKFGDLPIVALDDLRVRDEFKRWRDSMAATPRAADYAWGTLKRILNWSVDAGLLGKNPAAKGGRLYKGGDRQEIVWSDADLAAFQKVASVEVWNAVAFAFFSGQRQGDLLRMTWGAYDGSMLKVRQSKHDKRVVIPVRGMFKAFLDSLPRVSTQILVSSTGRPWTSSGYETSFGRARKKAGLQHLNYHDLRGTRITRLALAGCSIPQIAAITGHSLEDVTSMLDKNYMGGRAELALQAVDLMEAHLASARALPAPGGGS